MIEEIFKYKQANFEKLIKYGFKQNKDYYEINKEILNGEFILSVYISKDGQVSTKVIERESNEEYILYLMENAVGGFIGNVRDSVERVLRDVCDSCFERNVFKSRQAREVIDYIQKEYGDELEFLWEKFSKNAVWRRKDNSKWYGILLTIPKSKLGIDSDEVVEIIDLRAIPEQLEKIVDNIKFFKGYHMNKNHWLTICLDGSVSTEEIKKLVSISYDLAKTSKSRKNK